MAAAPALYGESLPGPRALPWASVAHEHAPRVSPPGYDGGLRFAAARNDSVAAVRPPVDPSRAMLHSLMLPGWGQLDNGSRKKAALCIAAELFFIGGYIYENHQAHQDGILAAQRDAYRTDRNSFVIYWFLAKVFGITDAYVDAQLAGYDVGDITPPELRKPSDKL
jgi:hypothetical protein